MTQESDKVINYQINRIGIIFFSIILLLAGCGKDESEQSQAQATQPGSEEQPAPVVVNWYPTPKPMPPGLAFQGSQSTIHYPGVSIPQPVQVTQQPQAYYPTQSAPAQAWLLVPAPVNPAGTTGNHAYQNQINTVSPGSSWQQQPVQTWGTVIAPSAPGSYAPVPQGQNVYILTPQSGYPPRPWGQAEGAGRTTAPAGQAYNQMPSWINPGYPSYPAAGGGYYGAYPEVMPLGYPW